MDVVSCQKGGGGGLHRERCYEDERLMMEGRYDGGGKLEISRKKFDTGGAGGGYSKSCNDINKS